MASRNIVDEFDAIACPADGDIPARLPLLRFAPRQLIARYWPRSPRAAAYARQKWAGTDLAQVREQLAILERAAGLAREFCVREVFPQLFHVRRA